MKKNNHWINRVFITTVVLTTALLCSLLVAMKSANHERLKASVGSTANQIASELGFLQTNGFTIDSKLVNQVFEKYFEKSRRQKITLREMTGQLIYTRANGQVDPSNQISLFSFDSTARADKTFSIKKSAQINEPNSIVEYRLSVVQIESHQNIYFSWIIVFFINLIVLAFIFSYLEKKRCSHEENILNIFEKTGISKPIEQNNIDDSAPQIESKLIRYRTTFSEENARLKAQVEELLNQLNKNKLQSHQISKIHKAIFSKIISLIKKFFELKNIGENNKKEISDIKINQDIVIHELIDLTNLLEFVEQSLYSENETTYNAISWSYILSELSAQFSAISQKKGILLDLESTCSNYENQKINNGRLIINYCLSFITLVTLNFVIKSINLQIRSVSENEKSTFLWTLLFENESDKRRFFNLLKLSKSQQIKTTNANIDNPYEVALSTIHQLTNANIEMIHQDESEPSTSLLVELNLDVSKESLLVDTTHQHIDRGSKLKGNLLVISSDTELKVILKNLLSYYDINIDFASTDLIAKEKLHNQNFSLVICDSVLNNQISQMLINDLLRIRSQDNVNFKLLVAERNNAKAQEFLDAVDDIIPYPLDDNKIREMCIKHLSSIIV